MLVRPHTLGVGVAFRSSRYACTAPYTWGWGCFQEQQVCLYGPIHLGLGLLSGAAGMLVWPHALGIGVAFRSSRYACMAPRTWDWSCFQEQQVCLYGPTHLGLELLSG